MKDDPRRMEQFKAKRALVVLIFFKNLTFLCSLGKFLLIENFFSVLIQSPLLNG
jgi:hypothetical protein